MKFKAKKNEVIYILSMIILGYTVCVINLYLYLYLYLFVKDSNISQILFDKTFYWINVFFILFNVFNLIFYLLQRATKINEYVIPLVAVIYFIFSFCLLFVVAISQEFDRQNGTYQFFVWMFLIQSVLIYYIGYISIICFKKTKILGSLSFGAVSVFILYILLSLICMLDGRQISIVYDNNIVGYFFITKKSLIFQQFYLVLCFIFFTFFNFLRRR